MGGIYLYPNVGRAGLGNVMLPWARAEVFRQLHSLPMLAPQWTQLKIGPLLRREQDLRYYTGLFSPDAYVRGWRRFMLLKTARRVPEEEAAAFVGEHSQHDKNVLIEFKGLKDFFQSLLPHQNYLKQRLNQIVTPFVQQEIESEPIDFELACHIRRGDKPTMTLGQSISSDEWHNALPLDWFANLITAIQEVAERPVRVCVFSDGSDEQLAQCLSLPDVRRARPKSAIGDIMSMARAKLLITTGTSTFSFWAAFLGQMPSFWYPSLVQKLSAAEAPREIEADLYGKLVGDVSAKIRDALEL